MKNQYRKSDNEFENGAHIERKKKASAKVFSKQTKEKEVLEYGLEDEDDLIDYEKYIK